MGRRANPSEGATLESHLRQTAGRSKPFSSPVPPEEKLLKCRRSKKCNRSGKVAKRQCPKSSTKPIEYTTHGNRSASAGLEAMEKDEDEDVEEEESSSTAPDPSLECRLSRLEQLVQTLQDRCRSKPPDTLAHPSYRPHSKRRVVLDYLFPPEPVRNIDQGRDSDGEWEVDDEWKQPKTKART